MLVITQETDKAFASEMESCARQDESWRCLVFRFSQLQNKPEGWFPQLLDKISSSFGESGGRSFLFEDGDVYILLRYATQKGFAALIAQISVSFSPETIQDKAFLYELPVDLPTLRDLLADRKRKVHEHSRKQEINGRNAEIYDKTYDDMIRTLSARRAKRTSPGILVVEDDPFSLKLVCKTLGQNGTIYTAQDGRSAVESYLFNAPDILFLDIGLPDASGIELIEDIFKIDPSAYIVMLSGNGNRDNVIRAVEKGAQGFVAKPFARERLFHYIGKCPHIQQKTVKA